MLVIGIACFKHRAQAQDIHGIFGSRSSELFFEEGSERLEMEIELLQQPSNDNEEILEIEESIEHQHQDEMLSEQGLIDDGVILSPDPSIDSNSP